MNRHQAHGGDTLCPEIFLHALRCLVAGLIVVEAEVHPVDLRIGAKHLLHRREGRAAAGYIVPRLPVVRMQGDIGQQVDRGLENIE